MTLFDSTDRCRKRGVILTCYIDGRKTFRVAPIPDEGGCQPDGSRVPNADARRSTKSTGVAVVRRPVGRGRAG